MEQIKQGPQPLTIQELHKKQEQNKDTFRVAIPKNQQKIKTKGGQNKRLRKELQIFQEKIKVLTTTRGDFKSTVDPPKVRSGYLWNYMTEYNLLFDVITQIKKTLRKSPIDTRIWELVDTTYAVIRSNRIKQLEIDLNIYVTENKNRTNGLVEL